MHTLREGGSNCTVWVEEGVIFLLPTEVGWWGFITAEEVLCWNGENAEQVYPAREKR